ncbi:protein of unknown function [Methylocaldum szegediense]|uniref:Uncharacterized protein n=1 Tax=Methylocaldum szegediense TaxID=73780 RepID=A0ABM9I478_9GAMM|nr:protein of unknown function [Methylocaldum szegediense]
MPRYVVRLTEAEHQRLEELWSKGRHAATTATPAHILLKADKSEAGPDWRDGAIVPALDTSLSTVHRARQEFVSPAWRRPCTATRPPGRGPASLVGSRSPTSCRTAGDSPHAEARELAGHGGN